MSYLAAAVGGRGAKRCGTGGHRSIGVNFRRRGGGGGGRGGGRYGVAHWQTGKMGGLQRASPTEEIPKGAATQLHEKGFTYTGRGVVKIQKGKNIHADIHDSWTKTTGGVTTRKKGGRAGEPRFNTRATIRKSGQHSVGKKEGCGLCMGQGSVSRGSKAEERKGTGTRGESGAAKHWGPEPIMRLCLHEGGDIYKL